MTEKINSYYKGVIKEAFYLVGIAIINFALGLLAIAKWGDVGAGILVILGGFAIYQIAKGIWILVFNQNLVERNLNNFSKNEQSFVNSEIKTFEADSEQAKKYQTYKIISFLFGVLCLLMGAFGSWSELTLGIGAGLAAQSAIMLIIGLLADFRSSFYLHNLKKYKHKE